MTVDAFLKEVTLQGVDLWTQGEQLRYRGTKADLTPDLLAKIKEHKAELLPLLAETVYQPLSQGQKALWFLQQSAPENSAYHLGLALRIRSPLDVTALRRALQTLIDRHPALRTTFPMHKGEPIQAIHQAQLLDLTCIDAQEWDEDELRRQVVTAHEAPFDLEQGPLLRASLFAHAAQDHILLLSLHHLITDGWSFRILLDELRVLYRTTQPTDQAEAEAALPPLTHSYADYVRWQRDLLTGAEGERLRTFWQEQLAGELPLLNLPTDRSLPPVQRYDGAAEYFQVDPAIFQQIKKVARDANATVFATLLTAFQVLLHRYDGQEEVVLGTFAGGRPTSEFNATVGYFVNPVAVRTSLAGNPSFKALLAQVRQTVAEALHNQHYPFPLLVEQLHRQRDMSHPPVFQAVINLLSGLVSQTLADFNLPGDASGDASGDGTTTVTLGELELEPFPVPYQEGAFFLTLELWESAETVRGFLKYNTDLFDAPTIVRMVGHFQQLLAGIVADPNQPIAELPLLTAGEEHHLLVEWNDTERSYPHDQCVHQLFEAQVARTPDAVAVLFAHARETAFGGPNGYSGTMQHSTLTYRELNARANQLAHYLQTLGVEPGTLVGLCVERSLEMAVAWLGILKAGAAYVPLDPTYPQARLAAMMEDAKPAVLLTQERLVRGGPIADLQTRLPDLRVIRLDADWQRMATSATENLACSATPVACAYVIYTSGSTGQPKGVPVPHRGLCNVAAAQQEMFGLGEGARILQLASLSFDAATFEIVMALCAGATLCLAPRAQLLPGPDLLQTLRDLRINQITITPTALAALPAAQLPDLHTICVAGEACSAELVARWRPGRHFWNLYGPTEATIWATAARCTQEDGPPPIGRPIANTHLYILDAHGHPVPVGVPGELHIGGVGVVRGYLNRPELTAEKFIDSRFSILDSGLNGGDSGPNLKSKIQNLKLYKTGDLARYLLDGNIEFLGRLDHQVKIRGFRIELGEIEAALLEHPDVQACAVVVRTEHPGDKRLVAYAVAELSADGDDIPARLRDYLKTRLPDHMVPAAIVMLDALPLSPNGKIDPNALPTPTYAPTVQAAEDEPQTEIEAELAAIWAEVLGVEQLGRHANFFEMGGHSLLVTRLVHRVQEAFAVPLPVQRLFEAPTVAEMAREIKRLRQPVRATPPRLHGALPPTLVAFRTEGNRPPLFLTPPIMGVVFPYYDLVSLLDRDQPVYGLQAVGLSAEAAPMASIEALAAHYLETVRTVQPEGPYMLGGWSFGAHVAYEMAQQLHRTGQPVGLVALLDTPPLLADKLAQLCTSLEFLWRSALPSFWPYLSDYMNLQRKATDRSTCGVGVSVWLDRLTQLATPTPPRVAEEDQPSSGLPTLGPMLRVFLANLQATNAYTAQPYAGRLTLLRTGQSFGTHGQSPDLGWRELATAGVSVYRTPGHHLNLLKKPNVQILAGRLRALLAASQA